MNRGILTEQTGNRHPAVRPALVWLVEAILSIEVMKHRNVTSGPSPPNRFSGLLITKPSWPPAALTGGSTSGTSARSERSSHQRMLRMALLSCWSVVTKTITVTNGV